MGYFSQLIIYNLAELAEIFELSDKEYLKAVGIATELEDLSGEPGCIAVAIVKMVKPKIPKKTLYKLGKTTYPTVRKWTKIISEKLGKDCPLVKSYGHHKWHYSSNDSYPDFPPE